MYYDDVFRHIGEFGRYQKLLYLLLCLPQIFSGIQVYLSVFILHVPDHRCSPVSIQGLSIGTNNSFHPSYSVVTSRVVDSYTKCHIVYKTLEGNTTDDERNDTKLEHVKCNEWTYDHSEYEETFAMQTDLVCDKKSLRTHAVMFFMSGMMIGSLMTGFISDMFGRKAGLILSITLMVIPNISLTFVSDYWIFVTLRCLSGMSVGGMLGAGFVLGMEIVGPTKRTWAGLVFEFFWAIGTICLALLAYLIRDWRHLNLVVSVPPVLFFSYIWLIPESPRWLMLKGRVSEAEGILRKTARFNKTHFPSGFLDKVSIKSNKTSVPLWKACVHPQLLYQLLVIFYGWMVVSMIFYGMAMNSGNIGGNLFLNYFMTSFAELIGFAGCLSALHCIGRKPVFTISMILSGLACLMTIFPMLYASKDYLWASVLLSTIGKIFASAAFAVVFFYSGEIFPTVIRNSTLGIAAFFARIGGVIAPYIVDIAEHLNHDIGKSTPLIIFGSTCVLAGIVALKLPETRNMALSETIEDWINFGKSRPPNMDIKVSCEKSNENTGKECLEARTEKEEQTSNGRLLS